MTREPTETRILVQHAVAGLPDAWQPLMARHRDRLRRMIAFRLDQRLQGRVDPSDILQEVYLEAARQCTERTPPQELPFYLWLRGIAGNKILEVHRRHLSIQMRSVKREISLNGGELAAVTSAALAAQLVGRGPRPSEVAVRAEMRLMLEQALNEMEPIDREILALRHFEQLDIAETAAVLGIQKKAAGKRYLRAIARLRELLSAIPGGMDGFL